jgi:hypothetical protein
VIEVSVDLERGETRALWRAVGELVATLPEDWVLIGGLMVQLHALEHGVADVRVTQDIDVLGRARPQGALSRIDRVLQEQDFVVDLSDPDGYAWRYVRGDLIVDVLAPDGFKKGRPPRLGGVSALGVPGGQQALKRAEPVRVAVDGATFVVRRPSLLGAILIKARSLLRHADPDAQREDLLRLLSFVDDPRATAAELVGNERRWLGEAEASLAFESATLDGGTVRRARQAYRLLLAAA